jgi:hypothetical protein
MLLAGLAGAAAGQDSPVPPTSECQSAPGEAQPWANKSYTPECRARLALAEFKTLDEKLRFLSPPPAKEKSAVRDVAKVLRLPTIGGSDGPAGLVRGAGGAPRAGPPGGGPPRGSAQGAH